MRNGRKMNDTAQTIREEAPVAIIGYGTAGVNAAIALRTDGYDGPISVFSNIDTLPYSPILTSYFVGNQKTYEECFPWSAEELAALHLDVHDSCPVEELDVQGHIVRTPQGEFPYAKCVIATGSTPLLNGYPLGDDYTPHLLRSMDDAKRLKAAIEEPGCTRMLVSGASMVALKTLEACLNHEMQVTLVGMNPHVLDFNALPMTAAPFEAGLRDLGVQLRLNQTIAAVKRVEDANDARGWHLHVTFSNGEEQDFDEISVSHGMKSNLDFVKPGSLEVDHALIVDDFMRTSDPDVYAAGDVAQATEIVTGEKRVVGIWKNAAVQGACAGHAIAAELAGREPDAKHAFRGSLASNTIAVNGTLFISAGATEVTETREVLLRRKPHLTIASIIERGEDGASYLVGFSLTCDEDEDGGEAYDTGAMMTLQIEAACRKR